MKIVSHKLPVSGYEIDVESEPLFGEDDAIDNYVLSNTVGHIEGGQWKSEFSGTVLADLRFFKAEVLVKAIKNAEGNPVPGKVVDIIKGMNPKDGAEALKFVEETHAASKKK